MKQRQKQRDDEDLRHYLKWITYAENLETEGEDKENDGRTTYSMSKKSSLLTVALSNLPFYSHFIFDFVIFKMFGKT